MLLLYICKIFIKFIRLKSVTIKCFLTQNLRVLIMKVVAFNGSPRKESGSTAAILNPFLDGMRKAGAEVELFYTSNMKIEPCRGCTEDMLFDADGCCRIKDDMQELYPKLREAEIWVFASPNYLNSFTGSMKNILDRMEPLFLPPYEFSLDHTDLNIPAKINKGKIVLISTSGLWEMENFNMMIENMKYISDMFDRELEKPILRPHAGSISALAKLGKPALDIYQAAEESGYDMITTGTLNDEKLKIISRELVSKDSFIQELALIIQ